MNANRPTFLALIAASLALAAAARAQDELPNLAAFGPGGMPTASASFPNLRFGPQQAADDNADTGWVAPAGVRPVWLRVEWRLPVPVHAVSFRNWLDGPVEGVAPIGDYRIEAQVDGEWSELAAGTAAPDDAGWVSHALPAPLSTEAVRLVIESAAGDNPQAPVAVGELRVMGPEPAYPQDFDPAWQGRWIWVEPSHTIAHREALTRYLRRSFTVDDPAALREAWLVAAAFDKATVWINNHLLLETPIQSGGTTRLASVNAVPLEWLQAGENVLAVQAEDYEESGSQGFLAELALLGNDGTRTVIATDADWQGQADQGVFPDWRLPGLRDNRWVPVRVGQQPSTRWHWLWNLPKPVVAPVDTLTLTDVTVDPRPLVPGQAARVTLTFEAAAQPSADYAVMVRLGQPSGFANQDYELWGAALPPDNANTGDWTAGRHTVTLDVPIPDPAPHPLPVTITLARPERAAGLQTSLAGATADAYGVHLNWPTSPDAPPAPSEGFARSEVQRIEGAPTLLINGEPTPPILWASSYGNYRRYGEYAESGIKLFRPRIEGTVIAPPGDEEAYYDRWYAEFDKMMNAALAMDPEIRLLPIVQMDPPSGWLFRQPADQTITVQGQMVIPLAYHVPDRGQVRPTFMSSAWRRAGADALHRLVEHMRGQPYASRIVGLWFFAGRAGENYWGGGELNVRPAVGGGYDAPDRAGWDIGDTSMAARRLFRQWLRERYPTDAALAAAWQRPGFTFDDILDPARLTREELLRDLMWVDKPADAGMMRNPTAPGTGTLPMDYYEFMSEAMIDTFAAWGRAVKEASDQRLITGCYYGYAVPDLQRSLPGYSGHTAVDRAARTPWLDGYSSPIDYGRRRAGEAVWAFNLPDSMSLNGKLYVYEFDSRTHLASIEPKTYSESETIEVWQRDIAAALCEQVGWWWYEFATEQRGARAREWYLDDAILEVAARGRQLYEAALTLPDRGPAAQIAVFYHGRSVAAQDRYAHTLPLNIALGRMTLADELPFAGAPHDLYHLSDIPKLEELGLLPQYRLCILLNPFYLNAEERGWIERLKSDGRTLLWLYAPGLGTAPDQPGGGAGPSAESVAALTGIDAIRLRPDAAQPAMRLGTGEHPLLAGLAGQDVVSTPYGPGATWARFGNEVAPLPYVDTQAAGEAQVLGHWLLDGQPQPTMGALAVLDRREGDGGWASVYSAVPYTPAALLRNIARFAGVHIWLEGGAIVYANRWFVGVHSGRQGLRAPLRLPRTAPVYDVFERRQVATEAESVEMDLPPGNTALFFLGDGQQWEAAQ